MVAGGPMIPEPLGEDFFLAQGKIIDGDAVIPRGVQAFSFAHRLERVIGFGERYPGIVAYHRHAAKDQVSWLALAPALEQRLQLVAIRTSVKEKLDDLHTFAACR